MRLWPVAVLLLLPSCIDIDYVFSFNDDQSANVRIRYTIFSQLYDQMRTSDPDTVAAVCGEGIETDGDDRIQRTHQRDGLNDICETRIYIASVSSLGSGHPKVNAALRDHGVTLAGTGNWFEYLVRVPTSFGAKIDGNGRVALAGHYLDVSVTAPRIISSNGAVSDDFRTATVRIPMESAVVAEAGKYSFFSEVQAKPRWWPF